MTGHEMWVSKPELPKEAKIRVRKLRFASPLPKLLPPAQWVVTVPTSKPGIVKVIRCESWADAHERAFFMYDGMAGMG